jgi:DNA-directed RNA polymerase specialized sigma24 family protein
MGISVKGCHKCAHRGVRFKDYESSPCASCTAADNQHPVGLRLSDEITGSEKFAVSPWEPDASDLKEEMARALLELLNLREKYPESFRFVMAKIENPSLSYSEIAHRFKCRKQNVQYHLRKALSVCANLRHALLIDPRYNYNH